MEDIVREIEALADPAYAASLEHYFQAGPGGYGEGDVFLGVKMGPLRAIAAPYTRRPVDPSEWTALLRSPVHEHRLTALLVLGGRATRIARSAQAADELDQIARHYLANTAYVNNWDLVDVSCGAIVGTWLLSRDRSPLETLARSSLVWDRRIAMVACQRFLRFGEDVDLYRIAELLLADPHDLIHKAVGWSLREAGKHTGRDRLRAFLDRHAAAMPRTALRYAIEHFDPAERRHYLGRRASG